MMREVTAVSSAAGGDATATTKRRRKKKELPILNVFRIGDQKAQPLTASMASTSLPTVHGCIQQPPSSSVDLTVSSVVSSSAAFSSSTSSYYYDPYELYLESPAMKIDKGLLSTVDSYEGSTKSAPATVSVSRAFGRIQNVFDNFGYIESTLDTNVFFVPSHVDWASVKVQKGIRLTSKAVFPSLKDVFVAGDYVLFSCQRQNERSGCRWLSTWVSLTAFSGDPTHYSQMMMTTSSNTSVTEQPKSRLFTSYRGIVDGESSSIVVAPALIRHTETIGESVCAAGGRDSLFTQGSLTCTAADCPIAADHWSRVFAPYSLFDASTGFGLGESIVEGAFFGWSPSHYCRSWPPLALADDDQQSPNAGSSSSPSSDGELSETSAGRTLMQFF